jgi:phosphomannomutase
MVTASHNPPEYNGYKVYWGNGAQIIPPHDAGIAQAIEAVEPANRIKVLGKSVSRAQGLWKDAPERVENAYFEQILALRPTRVGGELGIVYTAMHGVGGRWALHALRAAGFTNVHPVKEQLEPDGTFPTVRFPNPEEKGAMDLSSTLAAKLGADLVLANDPDADRLAVMARDGAGALRMLTGDEVGVLLGYALLTQRERVPGKTPLVISTIVSSAQLSAIAKARGARFEATLTGFKWIANRALALEPEGFDFVFGYEEALGYTVGTVARDKDGVGTAVVVAELAAWCLTQGLTLLTYLEKIQREHGLFTGRQYNATLTGSTGAAAIKAVMQAFREQPPTAIGAAAVLASNDYAAQSRLEAGTRSPLSLPKSNVLSWELAGGGRVTLRPSGTEPKIKVYFEVREAVAADEPMPAARARALAHLAALEADFLALARTRGLP